MKPIGFIADIVSQRSISDSEYIGLRIQLIADTGAALFVLLVATALSVYKPWGRTPYGLRKVQQNNVRSSNESIRIKKSYRLYLWLAFVFLILLFIVMHLTGTVGSH